MYSSLFLCALCALFSVAYVMADCPNSCSGHGTCGENNICHCYPDYGNSDCSVRSCPFGVNLASGSIEECSGRGSCDQKNGDCKCDTGYEGEECGRTACPNDCSGHGSCDGDVQRSCTCDFGYSGSDCSSRQCPRGDDPLTKETYFGSGKAQQDEVQTVEVKLSSTAAASWNLGGDFVLSFSDSYGGVWTTRPMTLYNAPASTSPSSLERAKTLEDIIESLPNQAAPDVTVSAVTSTASNNKYAITFNHGANSGDVAGLSCHIAGCDVNGCQPRYAGVLKEATTQAAISAASSVAFFGDNAASVAIAQFTGDNNAVAISSNGLTATFATSPFAKDKTPQLGADIRIQSTSIDVTVTVQDWNPATKVLTVGSAIKSSAVTLNQNSDTVDLTITNKKQALGVVGASTLLFSEGLGQAALTANEGLTCSSGVCTLSNGGSRTDIDLRNFLAVGDTLTSSGIFAAAENSAGQYIKAVTQYTFTSVRGVVSGGSTDITDVAATNAGALNQITINKPAPFASVSVGDTITFANAGSNNRKFKVTAKASSGYSVAVEGNVVTEVVSVPSTYAGIQITTSSSATGTDASCTVLESLKGTKEAAVCSGRGSCDGSAGTCACYAGYTGENCDQQVKEM